MENSYYYGLQYAVNVALRPTLGRVGSRFQGVLYPSAATV